MLRKMLLAGAACLTLSACDPLEEVASIPLDDRFINASGSVGVNARFSIITSVREVNNAAAVCGFILYEGNAQGRSFAVNLLRRVRMDLAGDLMTRNMAILPFRTPDERVGTVPCFDTGNPWKPEYGIAAPELSREGSMWVRG